MSSKVLIDTQSPFRKSHTVSRSSGSKTQRDNSQSNLGNSVNFFGHNAQQLQNNGSNSNEAANPSQVGFSHTQQPLQTAGTLYQQQLRGIRNNSENRHSTNGNSINNNNNNSSSSAAVNTSQTSIKASQILRNNSNFSATPQKKKEQISMYVVESGGSKISHSTSLNQNFNQVPFQNLKHAGTLPIQNGTSSSSGLKQQSTSLSNSSQKFQNSNSIFTNNFAKENIGYPMHKHSISQATMQGKLSSGNGLNSSTTQQNSLVNNNNNNNNSINNNSINTNLTNSGNNQNVFYQMQNQNSNNNNNSNINNNSASLSPNQKTLYQNILNSSWKVNIMQNQTPRKTADSGNNQNNSNSMSSSTNIVQNTNNHIQNSTNNSSSKLLTSSSRSYSKTSTRQQPYIQDNNYQVILNASGKISGQNMSPFNQSNNQANINPRLNTSSSSSSKGSSSEEIKRLKIEIEQFKNREIKYLVRIATLEKETKKLSEQLEKSESINRDISLENTKIRRMNSFNNNNNNNTSVNMSYSGNSADKNLLGNTNTGNINNLTQSIDELQRSIRQKTETQDSTQPQSINTPCCQCGLLNSSSQNTQAMNSGNRQGVQSLSSQNSAASYNKYKLKYTQLRSQHKEILKHCIHLEQENKEIKSESGVMKQLYLEKASQVKINSSSQSQQQSEINQPNSSSLYNNNGIQGFSNQQQSSFNQYSGFDSSIEKIPSFLKALSIGQNTNSSS